MLALMEINASNLLFYRNFDFAFEKELSRYQSRICPNEKAGETHWYYIKLEGKIIGSVWLGNEKTKTYAVLGIFIIGEENRGKGVGKQAIRRIIQQDAIRMGAQEIRLHVRADNERAYRCYRSLGFQESKRFVKPNGVCVIEMCAPIYRMT